MAGPVCVGPLTLTDSTPYQFKCSTETASLYVQNKSRFTLYVAFQDMQPTATDSSSGAYNGVVLPGHQALLPVQSRGASDAERLLNAQGAFTGSIWIMPRDYSSTLATTGTSSTFTGVFLSAYGPYDVPPNTAIDQPSVDLSSQPRVIALPVSGGNVTVTGPNISTSSTPILAKLQFPGSLGNLTQCEMYLYDAHMVPTGVQYIDTNINAVQLASDGVTVLNRVTLCRIAGANNPSATAPTHTPGAYHPAYPTHVSLPLSQPVLNGFYGLEARVQLSAGTLGVVAFTLVWDVDFTHLGGIASVGGGASRQVVNTLQGSSPF